MAEDEDYLPVHTNTFGIPEERDLLLAYNVYKPSNATLRLKSEAGRSIYAEAFIENPKLGTLSDLCVRTLAKEFGPLGVLPLVAEEPLKLRIHYDSLKVDVPLEKCYHLTDEGFWRRVVLAKSEDKSLAFNKSHDWRGHGISLKYVELLEAMPAEYWDEAKMTALALKVKDYVTDMHIRRLKSLQERSFDRYFDSEAEESDGAADSSEMDTVTETEESSEAETIEHGGEDTDGEAVEPTESQLALARYEAEKKANTKLELHEDRERRRKIRAGKLIRRARREAKYIAAMEAEQKEADKKKIKKKKKKKVKSVFEIELSEDENAELENVYEKIIDRRNTEKYLHRKAKYQYPAEHCHHIDLSFIRHFDCLTSFTLEFLGPLQSRDYHVRHMNFSQDDIERLASGVPYLVALKVFRLRNSRMDARKLITLSKKLRNLPQLETVDFGNDELQDDCGVALTTLLHSCPTLQALELEGNNFGMNTLSSLGEALIAFAGQLHYLGLSNILMGDEALHVLVSCIVDAEQVQHLNLTGVGVSEEGIICCIAKQLLRQHPILRQLDLVGMQLNWAAGVEVVKALESNQTIMQLDCRGCNLPLDVEFDVQVLLLRNRFIAENSFIGDPTKTEEEIDSWVNRIKNPALLDALAAVERRHACFTARPDEYQPFQTQPSLIPAKFSITSLDKSLQEHQRMSMPLVYNPNEFDEAQFMEHVLVPGPGERFHYFQEIKQNR